MFCDVINWPNEVKTFDNQRNATQGCHMGNSRSVPTDWYSGCASGKASGLNIFVLDDFIVKIAIFQ